MSADPLKRLLWVEQVAAVRLPATAYRVAAVLAARAVHGTAFISRRNLALALGCDEARLVPAFRALVKAKLLRRGGLRGTAGRMTHEWFLEPGAESAPPAEPAPGAEGAGAGGAEVASNGVRKSHPKERMKKGVKARSAATDQFPSDPSPEWQTALSKAGAKGLVKDRAAWSGIIERFGLEAVLKALPDLEPERRWHDRVEAVITGAGKVNAEAVRGEFSEVLRFIGGSALKHRLDRHGEASVRAVLTIAKKHGVEFNQHTWAEAFEGRRSEYGGWDFWHPQPVLEASHA